MKKLIMAAISSRFACLCAIGCVAVVLIACSHDEDTTPSLADQNVFEPATDDHSVTADIRRNFFKLTGSYLLFTDSLRTIASGRASDGTLIEKTELLDVLGYTMMGYGDDTAYDYVYIRDVARQQQAADLVRQHLVPRLGKSLPYSFMIVDDFTFVSNGKTVHGKRLLGHRGYVISMGESQQGYTAPADYFKSMVADMVKQRVSTMSEEELADFAVYSSTYYLQDQDRFGLKNGRDEPADMWPFGFFIDVHESYFDNFKDDLERWLDAVTSTDRETFAKTYGSSLMMMNKYDALYDIITRQLGYVLD